MGHAHRREVTLDCGILESQFDRVHAELACDVVDDRLDGKGGVRGRRRAIGGGLRRVGEHAPRLELEVGELVARHRHRTDHAGEVAVGTDLVRHPAVDGGELTVAGGTDLDAELGAGRRARRAKHLFAAHHQLDRTAGLLAQAGGNRFEVHRGLPAEAAADLGRRDLDPAGLPAEHRSGDRTNHEVALRRSPHVGLAVGAGVDDTGMRLDVALVDVSAVEFAFDHDVGCRHGGVGVASLEGRVGGDVRWIRWADELLVVLLVGEWRAVGHGLVDAEHDRQELVLDLDRGGCGLRLRLGGGGNGGDRMAVVQHRAAGQHIDRHVVVRVGDVERREVVTGDHGLHARHRLGLRGVDRHDVGVGVRRPQVRRVQLARQVEVGCEAGLAHDLVVAVVTDRTGADPLVGLWVLDGGHVALLSCTAASWTERMILS